MPILLGLMGREHRENEPYGSIPKLAKGAHWGLIVRSALSKSGDVILVLQRVGPY